MRVHIRKLQSSHNNLSKNEYTGTCDSLPKVGSPFQMEKELLWTTKVIVVKKLNDKEYCFGTQNSLYYLTVIE